MNMKCKVFTAFREDELEKKIDKWLQETSIATFQPNGFHMRYCMIPQEEPDFHMVKHAVVIIYHPMPQERTEE